MQYTLIEVGQILTNNSTYFLTKNAPHSGLPLHSQLGDKLPTNYTIPAPFFHEAVAETRQVILSRCDNIVSYPSADQENVGSEIFCRAVS